ncbi:MAG: hypothetical protein QUU85_11270 [Candidatus Eisenbacteria bacterium]|nr:hypothetical protein [Candidatus Eisenbacteria bacterium]
MRKATRLAQAVLVMGAGCAVLASAVLAPPARAEVFLGVTGGWMDVRGGRARGIGYPYQGGAGGSVVLGVGLSSWLAISGEFGPKYVQPVRNIDMAEGLEDGAYQTLVGNIMIRTEPIELLQPYFLIGGGTTLFTFDYGSTDDKVRAWTAIAGFGFDHPLFGGFSWGPRVRYFWNRWRSETENGRTLSYPSGEAWSTDVTLMYRF